MTISEALTKAVLLPYQKNWLSDTSVVKVWEKSRRIGASYVEALACVMKAMLSKGDGGMNCYYLSYSKEMTVQFINDAGKLLDLSARVKLRLIADEIVDSLPGHQLGDGVGPEVEILPHLGGRCAEAQPGGDLRLT